MDKVGYDKKQNNQSEKNSCVFCTSMKVFAGFAILLGLVYPLVITGIAQVSMPWQANGSLIYKNNQLIGSEKIGQIFIGDEYFHSRPSACNYDASASSASNFAPTNKTFLNITKKNLASVRKENNIATNINIPSDMVTSSASGLDPNISLENAKLQISRVAKKRHLRQNMVEEIVEQNIDSNFIGIWGQDSVNVLKLNMALDLISGDKK